MKTFCGILLLFLSYGNWSVATREHPIARVIDLLQGLIQRVQAEGKEEEILYTKFVYWCDNSAKTLNAAITTEKADIEKFQNIVDAKTIENQTLSSQILELTTEIDEKTAAETAADKERGEAATIYDQAVQDLDATISAIGEAIVAVAGSEPADFIQTKVQRLARLPLVLEQLTEREVTSLFADPERPDILSTGSYEEHKKTYSWKSGSVVDLLNQLKIHFEDQKVETNKKETNAINAHAISTAALRNAITAAENSKTEKINLRGDVQADLEAAKGNLKNSQDDLVSDETTLSATQKSCTVKKSEWTERAEIRANEEKALAAGIDVLSKVSGVRTEQPTNPTLPASPVELQESTKQRLALLQDADPKTKVVNLLREEARRQHSHKFEVFANRIAASVGGPFDTVNNMIEKMIFQLMAEQKDEDDHKNWCDLEVEKTNTAKTNKEDKIQTLKTKIDDTKAAIALLANEIETANEMVAKLTKHMADASEIRRIGREENQEVIRDAKKAQAAIAQAVAVILEFYKDSGAVPKESWEFLQGKHKDAAPIELPEEPKLWTSSYTGVTDPTTQPEGIVAVLKTISADFAKMEADTEAEEEMDQKAYDDEIKASRIERERRAKEAELKEELKKRELDKVQDMEKSRKHTSDELSSVNQYMKELTPACVEGDSTYADRKAARAKEIDALKEAQTILRDAATAAPSPSPAAFLAPVNRRY